MELDELLKELDVENGRYSADAYRIVLRTVAVAATRRNHTRGEHVPPAEFIRILLRIVTERYGVYARGLLREWGIESARDIGIIVHLLADKGMLAVSEEDTLDAFEKALDLRAEMDKPFVVSKPFPEMPVYHPPETIE